MEISSQLQHTLADFKKMTLLLSLGMVLPMKCPTQLIEQTLCSTRSLRVPFRPGRPADAVHHLMAGQAITWIMWLMLANHRTLSCAGRLGSHPPVLRVPALTPLSSSRCTFLPACLSPFPKRQSGLLSMPGQPTGRSMFITMLNPHDQCVLSEESCP